MRNEPIYREERGRAEGDEPDCGGARDRLTKEIPRRSLKESLGGTAGSTFWFPFPLRASLKKTGIPRRVDFTNRYLRASPLVVPISKIYVHHEQIQFLMYV